MIDQLGLTQPAPLSVVSLIINLLLAGGMAFALAWHYRRYGKTLANRGEFAHIFPLIILATVLIISVVKSSLALSLGLVGALSIVRFRTPIKEPEELAYLFMAIAIGLGFGADQRIPTIAAALVIMGIMVARATMRQNKNNQNLFMNIEVAQADKKDNMFQKINGILSHHVAMADLRRLDVRNGGLEATYYIDCKDSDSLVSLMDSLNSNLPQVAISFIEQNTVMGR